MKMVKDNKERTLAEDLKILKRWSEYCENLYSYPENSGDEQARMGGNLEHTYQISVKSDNSRLSYFRAQRAIGPS